MSVRRFVQPDHAAAGTDQAGFEDWCGQLEAAIAVLAEALGQWAPRAADDPADMTVTVAAGRIATRYGLPAGSATDLWTVAEQTTSALTAPAAAARIDRVWIDATMGTLGVTAGTEGGAAPAIPDGAIPVARVALAVGQAAITNAQVTDERVMGEAAGWAGAADRSVLHLTAGTYALTRPGWARWARLILVGGAGGGGGTWLNAAGTSAAGGGGGGGGETLEGVLIPADDLTVVIGAGGAPGSGNTAGSNNATAGSAGGATTVTAATTGAVLTAHGGLGGGRGTSAPAGGAAGAGGTGSAGAVAGAAGGAGLTGAPGSAYGGDGGGSGTGEALGWRYGGGRDLAYYVPHTLGRAGCGAGGLSGNGTSGGYGWPGDVGADGAVAVEWL